MSVDLFTAELRLLGAGDSRQISARQSANEAGEDPFRYCITSQ